MMQRVCAMVTGKPNPIAICEGATGMAWIIAIAFFAIVFWIARRTREKTAERAASGQLQSSHHKAANGLVLVLFGLTFYIGYIHRNNAQIPSFLWIVVTLNVVALLLLRRALKRRYPYV